MKNRMSITDFFNKRLNAPLTNNRWSWGSVTPDGTVFLKVVVSEGGKSTKTTEGEYNLVNEVSGEGSPAGRAERRALLDLIAQGAPGYAVLVHRSDKREVLWYKESVVYAITDLRSTEDGTWCKLGDGVRSDELTLAS